MAQNKDRNPRPPGVSRPKRAHSDCPKYTPEIGERILELTATTTLGIRGIARQISEEIGVTIPTTTMWKWLRNENHNIWELYTQAKQVQAEILADEMLEICDDGTNDTIINEKGQEVENKEWVNRSRLRIETRKWLLAKLLFKKYGDNIKTDEDKPQTIVVNINKSNE